MAEFPGRSTSFTGASDVPFVPTYNFSFQVGFSSVSGAEGNLVIISGGDLLNFVAAANITQRPGMGVVSGLVRGFSGAPAENVVILLTDANGDPAGDVFYNGLGGTPDFIRTVGTTSTGQFTIFNVPPGEVFLRAIGGGRGNTRLRAFADSVSLVTLDVVRISSGSQGVVVSVGESNQTLPPVDLGISVVGGVGDFDGDGVANDQDYCPFTSPSVTAGPDGCAEGEQQQAPISTKELLSVTDARGFARFSLDAEGDYLLKLDAENHLDTYHELNTNRAQLAGTQAPDITKFMVAYSRDHLSIFETAAAVAQQPDRGMIFGSVIGNDGTPFDQTVIEVTNTAGVPISDLGGKLVYTNRAGDPDLSRVFTSQSGGYMIFNVPLEPMILTATASIEESSAPERYTATALVNPFPGSVYVRDFNLFKIPPPDPNNPALPAVFTVTLSGKIKKDFSADPVGGAQISALGMSDPLATTNAGGDYTVPRAANSGQTRPLLAGAHYVFKVSKELFQDTYQDMVMGDSSDTTPLGDMVLFRQSTLIDYAGKAGVPLDLTKGILIGTVFDLSSSRAAGDASLVIRDTRTNSVGRVYYFDEATEMPDPNLTETTRNGKYIVFNVNPGMVFVDVDSSDDSGGAVLQAYAGGVSVKNIGINNAPPPKVKIRGTVKTWGKAAVGGVRLSALGGGSTAGCNDRQLQVGGTNCDDGTYVLTQSAYNRQVVLARKDDNFMPTYNFDMRTFDDPMNNVEIFMAAKSEIDGLASKAGVVQDDQKGVILGEVRVPDFQVGAQFCADGLSSGSCVQTAPVAMVSDYFNEDLLLDLALLQKGTGSTAGSVVILFGNGDGTFRYSATSTVGLQPSAMESGDVNRDGSPDLVVLNKSSKTFSVLISSRAGRFVSNPPQYAIGTANPSAIALGDYNLDGNLDIHIADRDQNTVSIFLGNGQGGFTALVQSDPVIPVPLPPCGPVDMAFVSLDTDSLVDWVVACEDTNSLVVLRSMTGFQFNPLPQLRPTGLVLADFDLDGEPDIATVGENRSNPGTGKLAVVMSSGSNITVDVDSDGMPLFQSTLRDVAIADFDFDAFVDLAVIEENGKNPKVLFGRIGGAFLSPVSIPGPGGGDLGQLLRAVVVSDFDRNGTSDFIVLDEGYSQATMVLTKDDLTEYHPQVQAIDFLGNPVGNLYYFTAAGALTADSQEGDGRYIIFNVPQGLTVVRTKTGGAGNKVVTVYPKSLSYVKMLVQPGIFPDFFRAVSVSGVTVDAVTRPVGDVDISFAGSEAVTFSSPVVVQRGSVVGGAEYSIRLESNSEYIARLTKVGGGGVPPIPGDFDFDSHADNLDDCPGAFNPDQTDTDGDGIGDVCDPNTPPGVTQ